MNRVKFLLVSALAVLAFNGTGCDGGGSSVSKDADMTTNTDSPNGESGKTLADTRWKLTKTTFPKNGGTREVINHSKQNVVYEFKGDNKLIVTGKTDSLFEFETDSLFQFNLFTNGEHFYEYKELQRNDVGTEIEPSEPGPNLALDNPGKWRYFAILRGDIGDSLSIVDEWQCGQLLIKLK